MGRIMSLLSRKLPYDLLLTQWSQALNPVLANPITNPGILTDVALVAGTNVINHLLGQVQQGWFIVDTQQAATIHRNAPFNASTLSLFSSAPCTVSIAVF